MVVDDGGHVARVVREHHAVGADVLRARAPRDRARARAALAVRLRGPARCNKTLTSLAFRTFIFCFLEKFNTVPVWCRIRNHLS